MVDDRRARRRTLLIALAVFVAVMMAFARTLGNDFVNWDDPRNILENPSFRGLGAQQLRWMFTTFHMGHYQPLSWMTLGFDYLWTQTLFGDGLKPFGYHLTNNLLHAGSAVLVYLLARRLLDRAGRNAGQRAGSLDAAAALAALLFAVHPLRAESVAWATERRDVLSSFFLLLTVLLYLRACTAPATRIRWLSLALLAYSASLLSRAMGVTLPILLLILDWCPLGRLTLRGRCTGGLSVPAIVLEKVPFAVLAAFTAVIAILAQKTVGATAGLELHTAAARLAQACYSVVFYVWKTLIPVPLSPIYEIRLPLDLTLPRYIVAMVLVAATLVAIPLLALRTRTRWPVVVAASYAVLLLPVSGLAQSGIQEVADRYSYLPGIVLALPVAAGVRRIWDAAPRRAGLGALCPGVVLVLAALTWRQCGVWQNTTTLFTHAIAVSPEASAAQNGYGWVLLKERHYDDAERHLRRALEIQPDNEKAYRNLWATLKEQGRTGELEQAYRDAIRMHPQFAEAHFNLGTALLRRQDYAGAVEAYEAAVSLRPDYFQAHINLAQILADFGETTAAVEHCRAAIAANPQEVFGRRLLAQLLMRQNQVAEAISLLQAALRIDPNDEASRQLLQAWTTPTGVSQ